MRTLTGISSLTIFTPQVRLTFISRDGQSTYVHSHDDIDNLSSLEWEMPFIGGFGETGFYDVELSVPLADIKTRIANYNRAEVTLRVDVGSSTFYPHVGRVRSIKRSGEDLNTIRMKIVDRFLDDNPMVPVESLVDSYATVHPEDIDLGYPLYYGDESIRDFYHTATDCNIVSLLGPRNVSSISHSNSVYYNDKPEFSDDITLPNILLFNKDWSDPTCNFINAVSDYPFDVKDAAFGDTKLFEFTGFDQSSSQYMISHVFSVFFDSGVTVVSQLVSQNSASGSPGMAVMPVFIKGLFDFLNVNHMIWRDVSSYTGATVQNSHNYHLIAVVDSGAGQMTSPMVLETFSSQNPDPTTFTGSVFFSSGSASYYLLNRRNKKSAISINRHHSVSGVDQIYRLDIIFAATLRSSEYKKYSVFSPRSSSSYIAVSENPFGILDDVMSLHTGTPYITSQSSATQVDVQSYQLHCFMAERRPLRDIANEFGEICAVNMWMGDCGMVNYRTYQQSADAAVNRTLGPDDFISFDLDDSPIGSSLHQQELANKVTVKYAYHYQRNAFEESKRIFPANNAACNSVDAVGIKRDRTVTTEYITDPDVASLYLANVAMKYCQGGEFADFQGGPSLFDLELADVVKLQHPMIVGSEGLYQIIRIANDYKNGTVQATAAKLLPRV